MGYTDTRQKIIDTLMGRPIGTQIQPEDHQDYALSMLNYIREIELVGSSSLIGIAQPNTYPIEPFDGNIAYLSACSIGTSVTFLHFLGINGTPLSYTSEDEMGALLILTWNTEYWELTAIPSTVSVTSDVINYITSIRKTYESYENMMLDTNPTTEDGKKILLGQLVSVKNDVDDTKNGIYSRTVNGWIYQSSFNYEIVQEPGDNPNVAMSQRAVTEAFGNSPNIIEVSKDSDLDISDEDGNVLARFKNGNFQTKNFDSKKVGLEIDNNNKTSDLDISDEDGNVLVRFSGGHIKTKNFDSKDNSGVYTTENASDSDLDISDEDGNVLARFKNGNFQTKNFDSSKSGIYYELYGKRIINFGDSIAFGENSYRTPGDISTKGYSYAPMLADVINGTCINNAVSGYTIQQILSKVNSCLSQVGDIIFIEGGTNNMNNSGITPSLTPGSVDISIYTEPSDSPSTFAGYVERIMWVVKNNWKDAFVYWVIPHRMQTRNITQQNTYWDIVKQAAAKWGVKVINIYSESCFTAAPLELGAMYTDYNDPLGVTHGGTHPNTDGYKKYYLPIIYDIVFSTSRKIL